MYKYWSTVEVVFLYKIFVAPMSYLMQGHFSMRGVAFVIPSDGHTRNDATVEELLYTLQ